MLLERSEVVASTGVTGTTVGRTGARTARTRRSAANEKTGKIIIIQGVQE